MTLYQTLNLFKVTATTFTCTFFVPVTSVELLLTTLQKYKSVNPQSPQAHMHLLELPASPPTHFNTNTFTAPFQLIVNTYGIPRY